MADSELIKDAVSDFLNDKNIEFKFDDLHNKFEFLVSAESLTDNMLYEVKVGNSKYCFYAYFPIKVHIHNKDRINAIAEFICRANYRVRLGCFEFNMFTGDIRYKCGFLCEEKVPDRKMLQRSFDIPVAMLFMYWDGLLSVMEGSASPKEAYDACQKAMEDD